MKTDQPPAADAAALADLDAQIAERVMGWRRETLFDHVVDLGYFTGESKSMYKTVGQATYLVPPDWNGGEVGAHAQIGDLVIGADIPPYSTDIAAAWTVVEVMRAQWGFRIEDTPEAWFVVTIGRWQACEETAPLAIGRAALLAAGADARG